MRIQILIFGFKGLTGVRLRLRRRMTEDKRSTKFKHLRKKKQYTFLCYVTRCLSLPCSALKLSIYSYFQRGCRKKCTRQSRKVLWMVLSPMFLKEIWKNCTSSHGRMFARAKRKQQKTFWQLQCLEQCIDHIPYYLSGWSRAHFCRQPFSKWL